MTRVESICSRDIVGLDGNEPVQRAALLMREHHVGAVVVTTLHEGRAQVAGLVTDRDLVVEVLARGGDALQAPVARLVQRPAVGIAGGADLAEAVLTMQAAGTRRLLVHDEAGLLVGVMSLDDLLPALAKPLADLADALQVGRLNERQRRGSVAPGARQALHVPAVGTAGWQP